MVNLKDEFFIRSDERAKCLEEVLALIPTSTPEERKGLRRAVEQLQANRWNLSAA